MYFSGGQPRCTSTGLTLMKLLRAARFINFVYSIASRAYLALCAISGPGNFFSGHGQTIQMRYLFLSKCLRTIEACAHRLAGYVISDQFSKFASRRNVVCMRHLTNHIANLTVEFQCDTLALVDVEHR